MGECPRTSMSLGVGGPSATWSKSEVMMPGMEDPLWSPVPLKIQDEASATTKLADPVVMYPLYISPTNPTSDQLVGGDDQVLPVTCMGSPWPLRGSSDESR